MNKSNVKSNVPSSPTPSVKTSKNVSALNQPDTKSAFGAAHLLGDRGFFGVSKNKKGFIELEIPDAETCKMNVKMARTLARMLRDASNDPIPV